MTARISAGFQCGSHNRKVDADKLASMRAQRATGATLTEIAKRHGLSEWTCWHYLKGTTTSSSKHGPRSDISDSQVASLRHTGLSIRRIADICNCSKSTILARLSRSGKAAA
jgi:DNA-binding CsgD family transcriptional regulator